MKLKGNQLLLTSSRLQNYINGDLMRDDIKYRVILIDDVNQLLVNTPCTRAVVTDTVFTTMRTDVTSTNTSWSFVSNSTFNSYYTESAITSHVKDHAKPNQYDVLLPPKHRNTSTPTYVEHQRTEMSSQTPAN